MYILSIFMCVYFTVKCYYVTTLPHFFKLQIISINTEKAYYSKFIRNTLSNIGTDENFHNLLKGILRNRVCEGMYKVSDQSSFVQENYIHITNTITPLPSTVYWISQQDK